MANNPNKYKGYNYCPGGFNNSLTGLMNKGIQRGQLYFLL
jgi:hypothetical protein